MIVRSSFFSEMKLCLARAHFMYDLGLQKTGSKKNPDLAFGSLVHKAIELFHKEGKDTALDYVNETELPPHGKKTVPTAAALLNMYMSSQPPKLLEAEKEFSFKIGRHVWKGRFDGIVEINGAYYVVEHKTTSPFYLLMKPNDQFISYWAGARTCFPEVAGVLVNSLDPSRIVVNRYLVTFTEEELEQWLKETKLLLSFYDLCSSRGIFPRTPSACKAFGRDCPYLPLCSSNPDQIHYIIDRCYDINRVHKELDW